MSAGSSRVSFSANRVDLATKSKDSIFSAVYKTKRDPGKESDVNKYRVFSKEIKADLINEIIQGWSKGRSEENKQKICE